VHLVKLKPESGFAAPVDRFNPWRLSVNAEMVVTLSLYETITARDQTPSEASSGEVWQTLFKPYPSYPVSLPLVTASGPPESGVNPHVHGVKRSHTVPKLMHGTR
jgi:hypothetical protein